MTRTGHGRARGIGEMDVEIRSRTEARELDLGYLLIALRSLTDSDWFKQFKYETETLLD